MNEKTETAGDVFPDRLSTNPSSPYYNEELLSRDVGIRFKVPRKPMSRNIASARAGFASPQAMPRTVLAIR